MTPLDACDAIERFLYEHFRDVRLPAPDKTESAIHFYQMSLPQPGAHQITPRQEDEEGNEIEHAPSNDDVPIEEGGYTRREARSIFPAAVIKPLKFTGGTSGDMWGALTVVITAAAFDESNECAEGPKQVINILERIRQLFEKHPVLESRYRIDLPVSYELYNESVRPFFWGELVSEWRIRLLFAEPQPQDDYRKIALNRQEVKLWQE